MKESFPNPLLVDITTNGKYYEGAWWREGQVRETEISTFCEFQNFSVIAAPCVDAVPWKVL